MSSNQSISKGKIEFEERHKEALKCLEAPQIKVSRIQALCSNINALTVTRDNQYIVSGSDKSITLWDFETKEPVHRFDNAHQSSVNSVTVMTSGGGYQNNKHYIVSGSFDKSIAIWDIEAKELVHRSDNAHSDSVASLAIVKRGGDNKNYIVSGSSDKSIAVWDIEDNKLKLVHRFNNAHQEQVCSVTATTGGGDSNKNYIVSGSLDNAIAIWDIESKELKLVHRFEKTHQYGVYSVAVIERGGNQNKNYIVSGSWDMSIAIWDIEDKKLLHRFQNAHSDSVFSVAVVTIVTGEGENKKNNKQYIVSGSLDKSIAIWDIEAKEPVHRFKNAHSGSISVAVIERGGDQNKKNYIVSGGGDKGIAIWDIEAKELVHRSDNAHSDSVASLAIVKRGGDNKNYLVSGSRDKSIAIWDIEDKKLLRRFNDAHLGSVTSLAAMAGGGDNKNYIVSGSSDKSIAIWHFETKEPVHRFANAHEGSVNSVAVMTMAGGDNKNYIISGGEDSSIALWDVENKTLKLLHRFKNAHRDREGVSSLAVIERRGDKNNNKSYIVSAGYGLYDKSIAIWDIEDNKLKLVHRFEKAHQEDVFSVAVVTRVTGEGENKKKNKQYIVSGSRDKSIAIWDIETKELVHRFNNAHSEGVTSVAVVTVDGGGDRNNNKNYIVSGSFDKSIAIWDIENNKLKLVHRFNNAHQEQVCSVTATTGGGDSNKNYIVSGSRDKSIAIWDIEGNKPLHRFRNHEKAVNAVITGGDKCQYIVSGSEDASIGIWDFERKKPLKQIKCREQESNLVYSLEVDSLAVMTGGGDKNNSRKYIISGEGRRDQDDYNFRISIWDFETKKLVYQFNKAHGTFIWSLAVVTVVTGEGENKKNNKQYIVSGSRDKSIAIWDIEAKELVHKFDNAHESDVKSVAVIERGGYKNNKNSIVSGSLDKSIAIWDIEGNQLKLVHRFVNAHQEDVLSVAATTGGGDSNKNYIVSGSRDKSIAIWDIETKELKLVHRFDNAHQSWVNSVTVMTSGGGDQNNKHYIVSGSSDNSIAIWDIETKELVHRFKNTHQNGVNSVAVMKRGGDNNKNYIVSGGEDGLIAIWDIQKPLQSVISLIPQLILNYSKLSADPSHLKLQDMSFLADIKFLSLHWNFLNFAILLLSKLDEPSEYLKFVINNKIYLSLDAYGKSQLDYLLNYHGDRSPAVYKFISIFFKEMPKLINFKSLGRERLLSSLAKLTIKIYKTQTSASLLGYLKCFVRPVEDKDIFDPDNLAKLPHQGNLKNGQDQAFIKLKGIVPLPTEYSDTIETVTDSSENNFPTLQYELVLLPLDYSGNSLDTFQLLKVFESFEVEDDVFYADPTVNYLIDFLWEKLERYLYFQVYFFAANTALYTIFGIYYQDEQVSTPILIIVVVMNALALFFEGLQESAGLGQFLKDPWNYFEVVTPVFQIISAILYWTDQGSLAETIFISTSILLLYTKLLITMRVFDQLRHMIRMILEILYDSIGFMIVIFTYAFGLTIAVYHNREVQQNSDGSGIYALNDVLMEMYAFAIGSWNYTEYTGINIAFFLFASFLLPLVLLNMLIAHMGDTYGKVQDNHQAFDNREKVLMLYELVSAAYQFKCLVDWIQGRKADEKSEAKVSEKESFYLLVVKEFSLSDDQIDMKSLNESQKAIQREVDKLNSKIDDKVVSLKSDLSILIDDKIGLLENKMGDKIGSLKNEIGTLDNKIGSLDNKIGITNIMFSEILFALDKKLNPSHEKV